MANETVYDVAVVDNRRRLDSGQTVVEARLHATAPIGKVLSLQCDCAVTPGETLNGEARYAGKVFYKALYLDNEGTPRALDYTSEFSGSIASPLVKPGGSAEFTAAVLDTDVTAATETEIKAAAVVEITLCYTDAENIRYVSRGGDGVYTMDERIVYSKLEGAVSGSFGVTDTLENATIGSVIVAEARLINVKKTAGIDCVNIGGDVVCDLVCTAPDGLLVSYRVCTPFQEEAACHGARADYCPAGQVTLENVKVEVVEGETVAVELDYDIHYTVKVFSEQSATVVTDAFSPTDELIKTVAGVELCRPATDITVCETLDGSVVLKDDMPPADNVLAVCGTKCSISDCKTDEGRVTVTGMVTGSIVYYSAENNSVSSAAFELPFSVATGVTAGADAAVFCAGKPVETTVRIRRGNELDIKTEVCLELAVTERTTVAVISELKIGEPLPLNDSAFSVYIARENESLWDAAKALGMTPEQVVLGNPTLTFPLKGGERVLAFRHLEKQ